MISIKNELENQKQEEKISIKCVVWDLDNTLWNGVLLEDKQVLLRDNIVNIIKTLDSRGILQSIASKNNHEIAINKLQEFNLQEYFLYPQINWNSKVNSLQEIAKSLNIGIDAIAFIDDQKFELDEVSFYLPEVLCIDASKVENLLDMPQMNPRFITEDSKIRRLMYISDIERKNAEQEFIGTSEEFLATLQMSFTISFAQEEDLQRAEELTIRTHQLNTTGYTYSYEELNNFRCSENHKLIIASLEDKYGSYGKIGLALIECQENLWTVKLLLMSCRVISRGVGTVMLNYIIKLAQENNVRLRAEFLSNNRNRMMYVSYKFAGFKEVKNQEKANTETKNTSKKSQSENQEKLVILENDFQQIQSFPKYMQVNIID